MSTGRRELLSGLALGAAGLAAGPVAAAGREIRFATISANYREGFEAVASAYERARPGVRVDVQVLPANGYETWLRTQIPGAGAAGPDIINANYAWGMYERGLISNLNTSVTATNPYTGRPWIETLSRQFIEKFKVGGDVTFIPLDFIEIGFYYNRDLFRRFGLQPPADWDAMLAMAAAIRARGVIPFAVPGNADSYWSGTVGWIARFFTDAYTRHLVPLVLSRPGDWDYDAARNGRFRLDLRDAYNDAYVVTNAERILMAVRDGKVRMDSPRFAEAYQRIKQFASFWQRGYHGATTQTAYHLFLTGRAAVLLDTSSLTGQLLRDMDELPMRLRFDWGVFPVPPLRTSPFRLPPFRGVGGPGTSLGVVKKSPEQTRLVVDFLMFLTAPANVRVLVDFAVRNRKPLVGPMLVPGVPLPPGLADRFRPFEGRGFERLSWRGLLDEQQSVWEWTVWAQRYMDGRITLQDFLTRYQRSVKEAIPRVVALQHLDMDPRTRDNKG